MNQNEQGMLYTFQLSGSRMRKTAANLRRSGQTVDALALVRRAAEQEDTPAAWLALAEELRLSGNWEAAAQLLARVMSQEPEHPCVWLSMGRCLEALGQEETALDCAYHQLRVAPWTTEGDVAREMIARLQTPEKEHETGRVQRLIHRALAAWQGGNRPLGERRIRRALRLTEEKQSLLASTAMLCMMELDLKGAMRYLTKAQRYAPRNARILASLSTLCFQQGKVRTARGLLCMAGKYAVSVPDEDSVLTAAWAQDAWDEMDNYLKRQRKNMPFRTALMAAEAGMQMETGALPQARDLWRDIIAVNPEERYASALLSADEETLQRCIATPRMLLRSEGRKHMAELTIAARNGKNLLGIGSRNRRLMDWCLASGEEEERSCAMMLLEICEKEEVAIFLRELLCRPLLRAETRQWALLRLAEMGCEDMVPILMGNRFSIIRCCKAEEQARSLWGTYLRTLLPVTRHCRRSREIVAFAAEIWRQLPEHLRRNAGDRNCYTWSVAVEALFLLAEGEEENAARVVKDACLSARRISRVIRQINRCVMQENVQPELENGDT